MKKAFFVAIIIVFSLSTFFACSGKPENDWALSVFCSQLEETESLAKLYFGENSFRNTLVYIRSKRYGDIYWNTLAGASDPIFEQFVLENSVLNSAELRYVQSIFIPSTSDVVDFVHMVGTMNMALNGREAGDLGGFAGDITQLVQDIAGTVGEFEEIYAVALSRFGESGGFDYPDVLADIDAINLIARAHNSGASFAQIFKEYYIELTHSKRIDEYLLNEFGKQHFNTGELRTIVYNRVIDNISIKLLFAKEGISMTKHSDCIKACCYVYADYLLS